MLKLSLGETHKDIIYGNNRNGPKSDWYHITVENLSSNMDVRNCYSYILSIKKIDGESLGKNLVKYNIEINWAGFGDFCLNIPKKCKRDLDAFFTINGMDKLLFNQKTTSSVYSYPPLEKGDYEIIYTFFSDTLTSSCKLKISFDGKSVLINSFEQTED